MGLLNLSGRITFYQVMNQYLATVIQLLWGDFDCGHQKVHILTNYLPSSGNQIVYPSRHEAKLS